MSRKLSPTSRTTPSGHRSAGIATARSSTGLAASPGTSVLPMCCTSRAGPCRAAATVRASSPPSSAHSGRYGTMSTGSSRSASSIRATLQSGPSPPPGRRRAEVTTAPGSAQPSPAPSTQRRGETVRVCEAVLTSVPAWAGSAACVGCSRRLPNHQVLASRTNCTCVSPNGRGAAVISRCQRSVTCQSRPGRRPAARPRRRRPGAGRCRSPGGSGQRRQHGREVSRNRGPDLGAGGVCRGSRHLHAVADDGAAARQRPQPVRDADHEAAELGHVGQQLAVLQLLLARGLHPGWHPRPAGRPAGSTRSLRSRPPSRPRHTAGASRPPVTPRASACTRSPTRLVPSPARR